MKITKVMCNWAPHCENRYCTHGHPHTPDKVDQKYKCNQAKNWCPSEDEWVRCVKVISSPQQASIKAIA
uniref:Uncharacterized protein n=1 Tax=viral metagenome TaxID=1070528 RepID=A0A6M3IPS2_9ZZZZ